MSSIRWIELNKYSLVWVEFGNQKKDLNCDDEKTHQHGLNMGNEFCYRHMAIVVSNYVKDDVIAVVPLTTYKEDDELYPTNIVIDVDKYGHLVKNKTTIKVSHIRNIDKKKRIKQIIKPFVSKTLQIILKETIRKSFE